MTAYDACLPPPTTFGLPEQFSDWRPHQDLAAMAVYESTSPATAVVAPTGFGKSPAAVAIVGMLQAAKPGARAAYLTETKGLQAQLLADFSEIGMTDVRGQGNYECLYLREQEGRSERCDSGPCHAGVECAIKVAGCTYYDAFRRAETAGLVLTNYDYWLNIHREKGLGEFDLLVLDEAHGAPDKLCSFLATEIKSEAIEGVLGSRMPARGADLPGWGEWARQHKTRAVSMHEGLAALAKSGHRLGFEERRELKVLRGLVTELSTVMTAAGDAGNWVIDRGHGNDARFDPIWPAPYLEKLLCGAPKTLLLSATIRRKTMELLGFKRGGYEFLEYPSSFPVERRPVVYVPCVAMRHGLSMDQEREWIRRVDQIIARRLDRKGIVHAVSYARARLLAEHSEYRAHMILNDPKTTQLTVERFRRAAAPAILVSPSVSTGYDFPFTNAEYCVIIKIPFQSVKDSPVLQMRYEQDSSYRNYAAMQEVVQMAGRIMRAEDDAGETIILDAQWGNWFYRDAAQFAPKWFNDAVRMSSYLPTPPEKLVAR